MQLLLLPILLSLLSSLSSASIYTWMGTKPPASTTQYIPPAHLQAAIRRCQQQITRSRSVKQMESATRELEQIAKLIREHEEASNRGVSLYSSDEEESE